MEELENQLDSATEYSNIAMEYAMTYGPKIILALLTLIIGLWVIKAITKGTRKAMTKRNFDPSLTPFFGSNTAFSVLTPPTTEGSFACVRAHFSNIRGTAPKFPML